MTLSVYDQVLQSLRGAPRTWLVTGAAGFIGSNLVAKLLAEGQRVVGLDNFITGHRRNLDEVAPAGDAQRAGSFRFIEGDIRDEATCHEACRGVDVVLHQAALGSVPRSIETPLASHAHNVDGFVNMLVAARDAGVRRFVYASSSSVYGDHPALPKREDQTGRPLSPYAVTKLVDEIYAEVFHRTYGQEVVGLRYFNVFGPRQDPFGPYAAVIPRWVHALLAGEPCRIFGDGETSRDFCYVANAVQANILAGTTTNAEAIGQVYNVAFGQRTTLTQLFGYLRDALRPYSDRVDACELSYTDFRKGDVRHSLADIGKAQSLLGYAPTHDVHAGIREAASWYAANVADFAGAGR